jgi:hypothetical protein
MAGGILEYHQADNGVDLGLGGSVDVRVLHLEKANVFIGVEGQVTANAGTGEASVQFGPTFSIQFGGTARPGG